MNQSRNDNFTTGFRADIADVCSVPFTVDGELSEWSVSRTAIGLHYVTVILESGDEWGCRCIGDVWGKWEHLVVAQKQEAKR